MLSTAYPPPEEIGISIISEVIKVRRGGTGKSLNCAPRKGGREMATCVDKDFLGRLLSGSQKPRPSEKDMVTSSPLHKPRIPALD